MASAAPGASPGYWAFISYSHRDEAVARWLQHALETYRVPRHLVGRDTAIGVVPQHVKPVFRDRDELKAGADLNASVREAIAASRFMIVICSPDAAASRWVEQEIVAFKRTHGGDRVLALIAGGEPFAGRFPGRESEECFPPALRFALADDGTLTEEPLEPIAADLREQGDGKQRALIKLLAAMLGVGFDELLRRDLQRRNRRLAWIAAGSFAGMLAMGVLTLLAVQARNEARHQHTQAEGLIEFMLGDLRKKLEPVGRLEVLDSVGARALAYYGAQQADRLDADSLGRRSRALHLIGEIAELRGNLDEALAVFQRAADSTGELLQRAPNDGQRIFDHAQSVFWVGYIDWRRGKLDPAEAAFKRYLELAQRLVAIDAGRPEWQTELAHANNNLGIVLLDRGQPAAARDVLLKARALLVSLHKQNPALAAELAMNHGWVAVAEEGLGNLGRAISELNAKQQVLANPADAQADHNAQRRVATTNAELSRLELARGKFRPAAEHGGRAVDLMDRLSAADPSNAYWQEELAWAHLRRAGAQHALSDSLAARDSVEQARRLVESLLQQDMSIGLRRINLQGEMLIAAFELAGAERRRAAADQLHNWLTTAGAQPLDAAQQPIVARAHLLLGDLDAANSRIDQARAAWRLARQKLSAGGPALGLLATTILAHAELRLDNVALARALADRIGATDFRHPAYAELVNRLAGAAGAAAGKPPRRP